MNWWCSALDEPWSWTWRAYPGVWLFLAVVAGLYAWGITRPARPGEPDGSPGQPRFTGRNVAWFVSGMIVLWASLDWPLGTLGTGYMASAHMLQYLLMVYVAPPLLLNGTPRWLALRVIGTGRLRSVVRFLAKLVPAIVLANVVLLLTHMPPTVDNLRGTQLGSFSLDMVWIVAGLLMWWPVRAPLEEDRLSDPGKMILLFLISVPATVPAGFLTWADFPLYRLYELAPPVHDISDATDQQISGVLMKVIGDFWIWGYIARIWYGWATGTDRKKRSTRMELRRIPASEVPDLTGAAATRNATAAAAAPASPTPASGNAETPETAEDPSPESEPQPALGAAEAARR